MQLARASNERLMLAPSRSFCPTLCVSAARSLPKRHPHGTPTRRRHDARRNLRDRRDTVFRAVRCVGNAPAPNDARRSPAPTEQHHLAKSLTPPSHARREIATTLGLRSCCPSSFSYSPHSVDPTQRSHFWPWTRVRDFTIISSTVSTRTRVRPAT